MITDRHGHDEHSPVQGVGFQQHGGGSQGHYLQFCPLQHAPRPRGKYNLTQNESTEGQGPRISRKDEISPKKIYTNEKCQYVMITTITGWPRRVRTSDP